MQIKVVVLTRIDQRLIGDTGMIHLVNGGGEEGREHLRVILKIRAKIIYRRTIFSSNHNVQY